MCAAHDGELESRIADCKNYTMHRKTVRLTHTSTLISIQVSNRPIGDTFFQYCTIDITDTCVLKYTDFVIDDEI